MLDREVKTTVSSILDLVNAAEDYGYDSGVMMSALAEISGYVTDEEIKKFCTLTDENAEHGFTKEEVEEGWLHKLTEWRDRYCNKD